MVRETGHIVVRKCGRCNDCCSVLFFWGSCHETENNLGPGLHGRADPFASGRCGGCRVHGRTGAPARSAAGAGAGPAAGPTGARRQRRHIGRRAPHAVPGADGAVRRAGRKRPSHPRSRTSRRMRRPPRRRHRRPSRARRRRAAPAAERSRRRSRVLPPRRPRAPRSRIS